MGNGVLAVDFVVAKFAALPSLLFRDVRILPTILDSAETEKDQACSEALNQEAFELMANLMTIKDL